MAKPALAPDEPRDLAPALERALRLFATPPPAGALHAARGYLDLLGQADPTGTHPTQRLMVSRALPLIYQRFWRPFGGRLLMGVTGPGSAEEHRTALEMLSLEPGDRILDVACGPGNFTRDFARAVSDGLAVGIDASAPMLDVAVRDTAGDNVAYIRGDARALPFRDGSFDAVCCFAALYLIEEPMLALAETLRVLAPGGRVALLASCNRGLLPPSVTSPIARRLGGVRIFGRDELKRALTDEGLVEVSQRVTGLAQFLSGRKPEVV